MLHKLTFCFGCTVKVGDNRIIVRHSTESLTAVGDYEDGNVFYKTAMKCEIRDTAKELRVPGTHGNPKGKERRTGMPVSNLHQSLQRTTVIPERLTNISWQLFFERAVGIPSAETSRFKLFRTPKCLLQRFIHLSQG